MSSGQQTIRLNCIVVGDGAGEIFTVRIAPSHNIAILKDLIKEKNSHTFSGVDAKRLVLWKVDLPITKDLEDNVRHEIQDKEPLLPVDELEEIIPSPSPRRVHIVVQLQSEDAQVHPAIQRLQKENGALFKCLQVKVLVLKTWSKSDVKGNLNGGSLYPEADRTCPILAEIGDRMAQIRTYNSGPTGEDSTELHLALKYSQYLTGIYEPSQGASPSVKDNREFIALFNILHCYHKDSKLIQDDDSSSLKTSNFTVYFTLPPFFSCRSEHFKYKQEVSLGFPIFVATHDTQDLWCTFTPKPDFMVSSKSSLCPFIVSEVVSQENESDRWRMLVQAIAIARAGQYLMKPGKRFFVVAIYFRKNLTAERFIVAQSQGEKVFISQKDFDLASEQTDTVSFLREMYNLATLLDDLEGNLDPKKKDRLSDIVAAAKSLSSLTGMARQNGKKNMKNTTNNASPRTTLSSIPEGYQEASGTDGDLGIWGVDGIQAILKTMECKIDFIPFGHPQIAVVSNAFDDSKKRILKFVREGRKETEILRYLTAIDSPRNHTISGVTIWPLSGGDVISMPIVGCWLTSVNNPDAHLWSIVEQLFEAVDFLHQHGVAHLDLKPGNILIPVDGGRLSIIDFNISVRVNGPKHKFCGVVGTRGYIPPEVEADRGPFSAVRADLWSCGKTLYELCNLCRPSSDRNALLEIARQLMDEDPEKRPMMSDVLEMMVYRKIDGELGCQRMAYRKIDTDSERFSSVGLGIGCIPRIMHYV